MAAVLKQTFGVDAKLIPGARGEFSVWRDGTKILDTSKTGDFPTDEDVLRAARS